ncbi:MAG: glucose 1-dehydrogenase [SAR202 cluster bacterium]|nr:glucose 1-dehydrogenase [SAR202 cluster bacterium]
MTYDFTGKVALVTGGNKGIGKAASLAYARTGAKVAVNGTDAASGKATVNEIRKAGGEAVFIKADVSNAKQVEAMITETVETFGRLDFAFNNAGIEGEGPITHEYPEDVWDRTIDVNLKGTWLCMKYELIQMLKQGGGVIVNMSSIAGLVGGASPAYNASKHGIIGLTRSATQIYADKNIRINAICPAVIRSPMVDRFEQLDPPLVAEWKTMHALGRFGEPREIADVVLWLCSDRSRFVSGAVIPVDGGWTVH